MHFFNVHKLQITDSVNYTYRIADTDVIDSGWSNLTAQIQIKKNQVTYPANPG